MTRETRMPAQSLAAAFVACALLGACSYLKARPGTDEAAATLTGAWRSQIEFWDGPLGGVKGLEFMVAFHGDGTLTESSNYDSAPPVPPAYGVWRRTGARAFEAHYEFYMTKAPPAGTSLSGGWLPAGRGLLDERITLAEDGKSFTSTIHLQMLGEDGQPTKDKGDAQGTGRRIDFSGVR